MAMRVVQAVRAAPPKVILAAGWLVLLAYAYPGRMGDESFAYLHQVRTRFYSDAYSPAIVALWRVLELVVAGPTGMFLVQSAMFVLGAHAILRRAFGPRSAAWATSALVVFPPVLVALAVISTQAIAAGFALLGASALASERRRVRIAGLVGLACAVAIQPPMLVATLPLVLALFGRRADHARGRGEHGEAVAPVPRVGVPDRRRLHALGAWLAATMCGLGLAVVLTGQRIHVWNSTLASIDLSGILDRTGDRGEAELQATGVPSIWELPADGSAPPAALRDGLAHAARELAFAHPDAYLRHRASVFARLLWLDARRPETIVLPRELPDAALKVGVPTRPSILQRGETCWLSALATYVPVFAPWLYLALAVVLLPIARRHRDVLAILASGIVLEATLFVTATALDYHQSLWLIACTCLAVAMLVARRART
jgi:hypothetical protein